MMNADWERRLSDHFSKLHKGRPGGRPIFALEHGLSADDRERLSQAVRDRVRSGVLTDVDRLPLAVYAAEVGYEFDGLEFWGSFAKTTPGWTDLWTLDRRRRWVRDAFRHFANTFGGAMPSGPWARKFGLIAWPVTHAILPLDLQRHLVRVLGQRLQLRAVDLTDPTRLGERIQAEAGRASRRFKAFVQETAFVGQIALAILEDDDQVAAYLDPTTVGRFVADIQRRRAEGALLDDARRSAQIHLRGLRSGALGGTISTTASSIDPTPRSLGLAVHLDVRPRQDGSWTVGLILPSLHALAAHIPAFYKPLSTSYLSVNGCDDDLPPGALLYGRRRVTLDRWPHPTKPLLDLESGEARIRGILAGLTISTADVRLFRIQYDGTTREITGRRVRPGERYIVLNSSGRPVQLQGGEPVPVACEGVTAVQLDIPGAPDAALRTALRRYDIEVSSAVSLWPAGPPPASWDGAGVVEWLVESPTAIGIETDAPVIELALSLDGAPPWSFGALNPGDPAFVSLGILPVGTHHLDAEALIDDGADGTVAHGRLDIRIRDRLPWTPGLSPTAPLHVRVSPPEPDLDELWSGAVTVEAWGPPGAKVEVRAHFFKSARTDAFDTLPATQLALPVTAEAWHHYVAKYLVNNKKRDVGKLAERASVVRITLNAHELGSAVVEFERHQRALRWIVDAQRVQLLDDRDSDDAVEVVMFAPARPLEAIPLEAIDVIDGKEFHDGGLLVARSSGDVVSSLVLPQIDRSKGLQALNVAQPNCDLGTTRRTGTDINRLLETAALWGNAQYAATSFVGSNIRRHVLCCISDHLAETITGSTWLRREREAKTGDRIRLEELAIEVPPRGERGDWRRLLPRLSYARTMEDRINALTELSLALHWLPEALSIGVSPIDATSRRKPIPGHPTWIAEFALRLASAPDTIPWWAGEDLGDALTLILNEPHLFRAARYAVIASMSDTSEIASTHLQDFALYPTWTWPSLD